MKKRIGTISWYSTRHMIGGSEVFWDQFENAMPDFEWKKIDYVRAMKALGRELPPNKFGFFEVEGGMWIDEYINDVKDNYDLFLRNSWTGGIINTGTKEICVFQDVHYTAADLLKDFYNPIDYNRVKHMFPIIQKLNSERSVCNVAVSNFVKTKMEEVGIKIDEVIPHGIDMDLFKPKDVKLEDATHPKVLYVGRFHAQKGWHILRELAVRNPNYEFIAMTMDKINYLPTLDNVKLLDPISREGMIDLYNSVDVVLLPSCCESFGLVGLEAAACNTPILTCKTGVWWDYHPKEVGEFADWTIDDFDKKLKKMLKNPSVYKPRQAVKDKFSLELWENRWRKVIEKYV